MYTCDPCLVPNCTPYWSEGRPCNRQSLILNSPLFIIQLSRTPPQSDRGHPPAELEGSATKYQHLPKDDDSSDSDNEGGNHKTSAKEETVEGKKVPTYAALDLTALPLATAKPASERNYVKIDHSRQPPSPPPPPPHTPEITVQKASLTVPARRKAHTYNVHVHECNKCVLGLRAYFWKVVHFLLGGGISPRPPPPFLSPKN